MQDPDFEEMLIRTVSAIELHSLSELLPQEVYAWWEARKAQEEADLEQEKNEALKFCERRIKHWEDQKRAASGERR